MAIEKRWLSLDDLTNMPVPSWMIEGLFERSSLVMLAGPSYSFKSFLLLDWMLCMASGRTWNGKRTAEAKVGYALGEGKASLMKRIQAWITYNDLTKEELDKVQANFRTTFEVPQLASKASTDNMLADLEREGFKPDILAVDTFARSMVGLDENEAKDTGLWVESADRLRQLGYTVVFLHHTKKNMETGVAYRGSTAIMGAMDTAMTLVRTGNTATLNITKQKDHDEGAPMRFRRVMVGVGNDSSCILAPSFIVDSRYAVEESAEPEGHPIEDIKTVIPAILEDATFETDAARARALSIRCGISFSAAQSRISRATRELVKSHIVSIGDLNGTN